MREAHLRYLLVAALVVVAGYGLHVALSEQPGESPVDAAATTPTRTPTPTTTESAEELAPGLTDEGVTDASNLSDAHTNRLRNTSYTVVAVQTTWNENRSIYWTVDSHARVSTGGSPVHFVWNTSGVPPDPSTFGSDVAIWHNDTHSFTRYVDRNGTANYSRSAPEQDMLGSTPGRGAFIRSIFGAVNTTVVERIDHDETTLYRVVSTSQPRWELVSDRPRSNYTLSALVDSSGLVHRYQVSYDVHVDDSTHHVSRTWRLSAVGSTTADQPVWIDEAKNATAEREG